MEKINLNLLPIEIDDYIEFDENYYKNTDIRHMDKFHIKGKIFYNLSEEIEIDLNVEGNIYLNDAITLEEIKYPINIKLNEILNDSEENSSEFYEKNKNILDINEFLWENIVLEVPISLTKKSGTNLKGNGWELNKKSNEEEIDPRLAKLNEIFKGGE